MGTLCKSTVRLTSPLNVERGWYLDVHLARPEQICQSRETHPCAQSILHFRASPWHQERLRVAEAHLLAQSAFSSLGKTLAPSAAGGGGGSSHCGVILR